MDISKSKSHLLSQQWGSPVSSSSPALIAPTLPLLFLWPHVDLMSETLVPLRLFGVLREWREIHAPQFQEIWGRLDNWGGLILKGRDLKLGVLGCIAQRGCRQVCWGIWKTTKPKVGSPQGGESGVLRDRTLLFDSLISIKITKRTRLPV